MKMFIATLLLASSLSVSANDTRAFIPRIVNGFNYDVTLKCNFLKYNVMESGEEINEVVRKKIIDMALEKGIYITAYAGEDSELSNYLSMSQTYNTNDSNMRIEYQAKIYMFQNFKKIQKVELKLLYRMKNVSTGTEDVVGKHLYTCVNEKT